MKIRMVRCLLKLTLVFCVVSVSCGKADSLNLDKSSGPNEEEKEWRTEEKKWRTEGNKWRTEVNESTISPGKGRQVYKELVDKLFTNNSPIIPPNAEDLSRPVDVYILMVVEKLAYLDMKSQTLNIMAWFHIEWYDPAFSWDQNTYPIDMIVVNEKDVWRPVMAIANTLLPRDQIMQMELPVSVFSNGKFHWFPGDSFIMNCHVNLQIFPFDSQTCGVRVTQWSHHSHHVNCTQAEIRSEVKGNGEWDITDVGYSYDLIQEPDYEYWIVTFSITMKRKWVFYAINLIFPIIMVSALNNVVFILPVDSGDKMSVSVTSFLTLIVFLTMIQDSLAKNSDTVCYITLFLAAQLTLGALAIVQSAVVVAYHHRATAREDPHSKTSFQENTARVFDALSEDDLCEPGVLDEEDQIVKGHDCRQPHRYKDISFVTSDGQWQTGRGQTLYEENRDCRPYRHRRGSDGQMLHKSSARDWVRVAAKIDSVCFPLFIGLNVLSMVVFCIILGAA